MAGVEFVQYKLPQAAYGSMAVFHVGYVTVKCGITNTLLSFRPAGGILSLGRFLNNKISPAGRNDSSLRSLKQLGMTYSKV